MTRQEIESAAQRLGGGNVQGALLANNPAVPRLRPPLRSRTRAPISRSRLPARREPAGSADARQRGAHDSRPRLAGRADAQSGAGSYCSRPGPRQHGDAETFRCRRSGTGRGPEDLGRAVLQSPLTPWGAADLLGKVGTSGVGEFYKSLPTPIESVETMALLTEKYPSGTPGVPDLRAMSPEDQALWRENSLNVGAMSEPVLNRMGAGASAVTGSGRRSWSSTACYRRRRHLGGWERSSENWPS